MTFAIDLVRIGAVAGAVAAAAMLAALSCRLTPRARWAMAVALGYVAGHLAVGGSGTAWSSVIVSILRPQEARDWLPLAVLAAAGVTIAAALVSPASRAVPARLSSPKSGSERSDQASRAVPGPERRWLFLVFAAVLTIGVPARLLAGSVYVRDQWSPATKLLYLAILAAVFAAVWGLLAAARDDQHPRLRAALLLITTLGIALALTLAGTFVYGQLCIAVAGAFVGAIVCETFLQLVLSRTKRAGPSPAPIFPEPQPDSPANARAPNGLSGAAGVLTMSLGSLIMLSYFYAELSVSCAALLTLALVSAGGWLPPMRGPSSTTSAAFRAILSLSPLAIALARTYSAVQASDAGPY